MPPKEWVIRTEKWPSIVNQPRISCANPWVWAGFAKEHDPGQEQFLAEEAASHQHLEERKTHWESRGSPMPPFPSLGESEPLPETNDSSMVGLPKLLNHTDLATLELLWRPFLLLSSACLWFPRRFGFFPLWTKQQASFSLQGSASSAA